MARRCAKWACCLWLFTAVSAAAQALPPFTVTLEPERLYTGSPCLFRVASQIPLKAVTGTWMWRRLSFTFDAQARAWYAFGGVGLEAAQARYPLVITATLPSGEVVTSTFQVPVAQMEYPLSLLTVDPDFLDPNPATRARIKRERALKHELFGRVTPVSFLEGSFRLPLNSSLSGVFGARRTYNGQRRGRHQGADYDASLGTPVTALNGGKVLLARNLFFEGNCVVLDHGQGLLTMYLHFSAFKVKEGDTVKRGQVLGLSGATGRVTGPHLHVAVRWQGIYVDPVRLFALKLP